MRAQDFLKKHYASKAFAKYMQTDGVREYKHFAGVADDYCPNLADAAMALHESIGREACAKHGFGCDVSGLVIADGVPIGRSRLAQGKATKDLSIAMWLEDVGQLGFVTGQLREEMDAALWPGWFDAHVTHRNTPALVHENGARAAREYKQARRGRNPWWRVLWLRLIEAPGNWRVRRHYAMQAKRPNTEVQRPA